jgi:hypothetical protein
MSKKPVAVITMAHNEGEMLSLWSRHYGRLVGVEALYILDHGSTDGSTQCQGGNVIRLPRDTFDDHARARSISAFQRSLFEYFDTVIYTDTDEFLVVDPEYGSLLEFLQTVTGPVAAGIGIDIVHRPSMEPPLDFAAPIMAQREYGVFRGSQCKPIIARRPIEWAAGFHAADVEPVFRPDAYLIHLKTADFGFALRRLQMTRSMTWSEAALKIGMGGHQRIDDDTFRQWFFTNRETDIGRGDIDVFDAAAWIEIMKSSFQERKGFIRYEQDSSTGREIKSKPFVIPHRIRGTF